MNTNQCVRKEKVVMLCFRCTVTLPVLWIDGGKSIPINNKGFHNDTYIHHKRGTKITTNTNLYYRTAERRGMLPCVKVDWSVRRPCARCNYMRNKRSRSADMVECMPQHWGDVISCHRLVHHQFLIRWNAKGRVMRNNGINYRLHTQRFNKNQYLETILICWVHLKYIPVRK